MSTIALGQEYSQAIDALLLSRAHTAFPSCTRYESSWKYLLQGALLKDEMQQSWRWVVLESLSLASCTGIRAFLRIEGSLSAFRCPRTTVALADACYCASIVNPSRLCGASLSLGFIVHGSTRSSTDAVLDSRERLTSNPTLHRNAPVCLDLFSFLRMVFGTRLSSSLDCCIVSRLTALSGLVGNI